MITTEDILSMSDEEFLKQASSLSKQVSSTNYEPEEEVEGEESTEEFEVDVEEDETTIEDPYEYEEEESEEVEEEPTEHEVDIFSVINELEHFDSTNPEDVKLVLERGVEKIKESLSPEAEKKSALYSTLALNKFDDSHSVATMIDIMKGNKEAIGALLNSLNIDPMELFSISTRLNEYKPQTPIATKNDIILNEAATKLSMEDSGKQVLSDLQTWDSISREQIAKNASVLFSLRDQKYSGLYDRAKTRMQINRAKGKMYASDIEAYTSALNELQYEEEQKRLAKLNQTKSLSSPSGSKSSKKKKVTSLDEIANLNDDNQFLLMANKLLNR